MLHQVFCAQLRQAMAQPSARFGELLVALLPHMDVYSEFVRNHEKAIKVRGQGRAGLGGNYNCSEYILVQ